MNPSVRSRSAVRSSSPRRGQVLAVELDGAAAGAVEQPQDLEQGALPEPDGPMIETQLAIADPQR